MEFRGQLPPEVVDECSVPKKAASDNFEDPLKNGEHVAALALSPSPSPECCSWF